jgi:two-component system, cell cycle response regulator DivK
MSALLISGAPPQGCACGAKVLVAEDHDDTRSLLRALLEQRGLSVVEAEDGVKAVDAAEREHPDLILMDGGLPLLDGFAVTRRLREVPALAAVPIVFLSGHAGPQHLAAALDAGCDDYIVKPFDVALLDKVLTRHLPGRGNFGTRGFEE